MGKAERASRSGGAAVAEPAHPPVDPKILESIHEETKRMGLSERIIFWDKRQSATEYVDAEGRILTDADKVERTIVDGGDEKTIREWPAGARLVPSPERLLCPNDPDHGPLIINGAGTLLLCGARKGGAVCNGTRPVSL